MRKNLLNEIEWRKLLIKRLKSAHSALKRDAAAERKRLDESKQLAAGYDTFEEAQEAYGWECITLKQLDDIKAILENHQVGITETASAQMSQIIGDLEGEIKMLKRDPEYRDEVIGDDQDYS